MKTVIFIILTIVFLCHSPGIAAAEVAAQAPTRTPSFTREGSESCLRCHSGEKMRALAESPHFDMNIQGTPAATHGCESCHGKGSIHISRAHGGKGFPLLTEFARGRRGSPRDEQLHACLSCHADDSMGGRQIVFLSSIHDRPNINCSNCHIAHAASDPMGDMEAQIKVCSRCHRRHIENHPPAKGEAIDLDKQPCSTCHDVHVPRDVSAELEE